MPQLDGRSGYYIVDSVYALVATVGADVILNTNSIDVVEFPGIELTYNLIVNTKDSDIGTQDLNIKSFTLEQSDDVGFTSPVPLTAENFIGDINDMAVDMTGIIGVYAASVGIRGTKQFVRGQFTYDYSDAVNTSPHFLLDIARYPVFKPAT